MRDAFKQFRPDIWEAAEAAYAAATSDLSGLYMPLDLYAAIPATSIDYAIIEKAANIAMVPAGFRWNDLCSWQSVLDIGPADRNGNVIVGDVVAIDCENSYLRRREPGLQPTAFLELLDVLLTFWPWLTGATKVASGVDTIATPLRPIADSKLPSLRLIASWSAAHGDGACNTGWSRKRCRSGQPQSWMTSMAAFTRRWDSIPSLC
jgi:hypothetical protein